MIQDVYIIGATGRVGKTLVSQIIEKGDTCSSRHANPTRIVGLASSSRTIYSPSGISPERAYAFARKGYNGAHVYQDPVELLGLGGKEKESALVFIDATAADEPITRFHMEAISSTPHSIVTANKNPLALHPYSTFERLTRHPRRYGYRCSVMAGAEAAPFLQDLRDLNDSLYSLVGCFSGTLGYITSELEKSRPLSAILREAHLKGYTEPHPRDDLSGLDVAKKLCILARAAGYPVDIGDIRAVPFVPREFLLEDDVERFLDSLKGIDADFAKRMAAARGKGNTLRYVARMDADGRRPRLSVSLEEVPRESHLGHLAGARNKIVISSESYPDGYSVESIGAGLDVTARNIRRDLLNLLPQRRV